MWHPRWEAKQVRNSICMYKLFSLIGLLFKNSTVTNLESFRPKRTEKLWNKKKLVLLVFSVLTKGVGIKSRKLTEMKILIFLFLVGSRFMFFDSISFSIRFFSFSKKKKVLQLTGKSKWKRFWGSLYSTPQFKKFSSPINPPKAEAQSSDAKLRLSLVYARAPSLFYWCTVASLLPSHVCPAFVLYWPASTPFSFSRSHT